MKNEGMNVQKKNEIKIGEWRWWRNECTEKERNKNRKMKNKILENEGMNIQNKNEIKIGKWKMKYQRMKEWIKRKRTK